MLQDIAWRPALAEVACSGTWRGVQALHRIVAWVVSGFSRTVTPGSCMKEYPYG